MLIKVGRGGAAAAAAAWRHRRDNATSTLMEWWWATTLTRDVQLPCDVNQATALCDATSISVGRMLLLLLLQWATPCASHSSLIKVAPVGAKVNQAMGCVNVNLSPHASKGLSGRSRQPDRQLRGGRTIRSALWARGDEFWSSVVHTADTDKTRPSCLVLSVSAV